MTFRLTFQTIILTLTLALGGLISTSIQADTLVIDDVDRSESMKTNISQPYVVKQGDTLWHIADHFFKDPWKWMKLWERNVYITNPDLIYPGNKIWFDGERLKKQGGLTLSKPTPLVIIKPAERLEARADTSIMLTALARQDFIQSDQVQGVGRVLDSQDERLNFGVNDYVYLHMHQAAEVGALFDVFRNTDVIYEPKSGKPVGVLVEHLGQIRTISAEGKVYRGIVTKAFEEISRGDRLKPAKAIDPHITPIELEHSLSGTVMYIRNNAREAAQNQVIGISLGLNDGLKAGTMMSILKSGRVVNMPSQDHDDTEGESIVLPTEQVGQLLVLVPQQQASIALITQSIAPIHIGDTVQTIAVP